MQNCPTCDPTKHDVPVLCSMCGLEVSRLFDCGDGTYMLTKAPELGCPCPTSNATHTMLWGCADPEAWWEERARAELGD